MKRVDHAATWVAGLLLSKATDVLDDRFDLGDAVGGMLLLGLAGSLPELAITASAGNPILPTASAESLWLGALGLAVTAIFAYGLLVRPEKKLWLVGRDSLLVLATYLVGVLLLTVVPG